VYGSDQAVPVFSIHFFDERGGTDNIAEGDRDDAASNAGTIASPSRIRCVSNYLQRSAQLIEPGWL
jgi:hypothetical protein